MVQLAGTVANDRAVLRDLATRLRAAADSPRMDELRREWKRHNALRPGRPLVVVWPEGAWQELIPRSSLVCADPLHRRFEWDLRAKLYQAEVLQDDGPVDPWFDVGWKVTVGDYGFRIPYTHGDNRGSFAWDPPMKDLPRDLDRLHPREFTVDRETTLAELDRARDLFGDILPARLYGSYWWTVGLTQDAAYLLGIEELMLAMYDRPDELHRLMAFLRDDQLRYITWCEREGLIASNAGSGDMIASGGYGGIDGLRAAGAPDGPATLAERWGFAESQETVGVSPSMFAEFILPYQVPLMERFGLNCYGCCEGLEHRIDSIAASIPRLRRVSVAPLANQQVLAEKLNRKYVFSRKPNPAPVCVDFDEPAIRADLRRTLRVAGDHPLELILKDTHTVQNEPWRLARWVEIAREEIRQHLG